MGGGIRRSPSRIQTAAYRSAKWHITATAGKEARATRGAPLPAGLGSPTAITPLNAAVASLANDSRSERRAGEAPDCRSARVVFWVPRRRRRCVGATVPPPLPLRPSSGLVVADGHKHARARARDEGEFAITIASFPRDLVPDVAVSLYDVASCAWFSRRRVSLSLRRDHRWIFSSVAPFCKNGPDHNRRGTTSCSF